MWLHTRAQSHESHGCNPTTAKNPLATRSIVFDGRRSLEELKAALAEVLGVPVSEFKLMKECVLWRRWPHDP